ncbi:uncharacterized protein LOC144716567 [Wolffia australiana]
MEDLAEKGEDGAGWTDEKHTFFLNCLEDSFVRWMMMDGRLGSGLARLDEKPLRLDRIMPDGSDSTRVCRSRDRGIRKAAVARRRRGRREFEESHGKMRKRWQRRQTASSREQDQIVPEREASEVEKDGEMSDSETSASSEAKRSTFHFIKQRGEWEER